MKELVSKPRREQLVFLAAFVVPATDLQILAIVALALGNLSSGPTSPIVSGAAMPEQLDTLPDRARSPMANCSSIASRWSGRGRIRVVGQKNWRDGCSKKCATSR